MVGWGGRPKTIECAPDHDWSVSGILCTSVLYWPQILWPSSLKGWVWWVSLWLQWVRHVQNCTVTNTIACVCDGCTTQGFISLATWLSKLLKPISILGVVHGPGPSPVVWDDDDHACVLEIDG